MGIPSAEIDDYREDMRHKTGAELAHIVLASAGFTLPEGLGKSDTPTLFVTGANEMRCVRRWAAALAQPMPNGVDRVAIGMRHDWPLREPDLFSRDPRRLVGLHVGPQRESVSVGILGCAAEITLQTIEVDNGRRRFEIVETLHTGE